jgi:hypothetical protein
MSSPGDRRPDRPRSYDMEVGLAYIALVLVGIAAVMLWLINQPI